MTFNFLFTLSFRMFLNVIYKQLPNDSWWWKFLLIFFSFDISQKLKALFMRKDLLVWFVIKAFRSFSRLSQGFISCCRLNWQVLMWKLVYYCSKTKNIFSAICCENFLIYFLWISLHFQLYENLKVPTCFSCIANKRHEMITIAIKRVKFNMMKVDWKEVNKTLKCAYKYGFLWHNVSSERYTTSRKKVIKWKRKKKIRNASQSFTK